MFDHPWYFQIYPFRAVTPLVCLLIQGVDCALSKQIWKKAVDIVDESPEERPEASGLVGGISQ